MVATRRPQTGSIEGKRRFEEAHKSQKLLEKKEIAYEIKIYPGAGHGFEDQALRRDAGLRSLQSLQKHLAAPER
jgi:dienelactone hydrolase